MFAFRLVFFTALMSFKNYLAVTDPFLWLVLTLPRFVFQGLFFVLIATYAGGSSVRNYALIGNTFSFAIIGSIVYFAQVLDWEKGLGTWPLVIATPGPIWLTLLGFSAVYLAEAVIGSILTYIVLSFIVGLSIPFSGLVLALPTFLIMLLSAGSLGWLLGAATLTMRFGLLATNVVAYLMLTLCGVNFPSEVLPWPLSVLVQGLPVTNGLKAIRELLAGKSFLDVVPLVAMELTLGLVYALVAQRIFNYRLALARRGSQLEIF